MLLAKGHSPLEKVGPNRLLGTAQWLVTLIDWECYLDIPTSIKKNNKVMTKGILRFGRYCFSDSQHSDELISFVDKFLRYF